MIDLVQADRRERRVRRADLSPVTSDRQLRGQVLATRRIFHRLSVLAVANASGLARATIDKAEAGKSSDDSQDRLEEYYDELDAEKGVDSRPAQEPTQESDHPDMIEFDITGPTTAWHVVVRAPVEQADEARRQAGELLREWEATRDDR